MKIILVPNFFKKGKTHNSYHVVLQLINRYNPARHGALSIFDWEARWKTFLENGEYLAKERTIDFFAELHKHLLFIPHKEGEDPKLVFVVNFDSVDLGDIIPALRLANSDMDAAVILGRAELAVVESKLWNPRTKALVHNNDIVPAVSREVSLSEKLGSSM